MHISPLKRRQFAHPQPSLEQDSQNEFSSLRIGGMDRLTQERRLLAMVERFWSFVALDPFNPAQMGKGIVSALACRFDPCSPSREGCEQMINCCCTAPTLLECFAEECAIADRDLVNGDGLMMLLKP